MKIHNINPPSHLCSIPGSTAKAIIKSMGKSTSPEVRTSAGGQRLMSQAQGPKERPPVPESNILMEEPFVQTVCSPSKSSKSNEFGLHTQDHFHDMWNISLLGSTCSTDFTDSKSKDQICLYYCKLKHIQSVFRILIMIVCVCVFLTFWCASRWLSSVSSPLFPGVQTIGEATHRQETTWPSICFNSW